MNEHYPNSDEFAAQPAKEYSRLSLDDAVILVQQHLARGEDAPVELIDYVAGGLRGFNDMF